MAYPVLIIGNSPCAGMLADQLLSNGIDVIRAARSSGPAPFKGLPGSCQARAPEVLPGVYPVGCSGTAGRFKVLLQSEIRRFTRTVAAIAVVEDYRRRPNYALYRLAPGPSLLTLSRLKQLTARPAAIDAGLRAGAKVVMLSGLLQESTPVLSGEVIHLSMRLQAEMKVQVYVLTGNLKVAAPGLESLHRQSKSAGVVYFKFSRSLPRIEQDGCGPVSIAFEDEISGRRFRLQPDRTVVDETILPSPHLAELAGVLGVDPGPDGFVQTDNVRRSGIFTNRRGVLAVGPSRGVRSEKDYEGEAQAAALAVMQLLNPTAVEPHISPVIDPDRCIGCLTCFRICPHGAITLSGRPSVAPESCENCGLCAAECPRRAISASGPQLQYEEDGSRSPDAGHGAFDPQMALICCSRSAIPAWRLACLQGRRAPGRLSILPVTCASGISRDLIYRLFREGADGVLIFSCHPGNCHSEQGNRHAYHIGERIREFFAQAGLEPERLQVSTLAANMGVEFSNQVAGFMETIRKLGPSPLRI